MSFFRRRPDAAEGAALPSDSASPSGMISSSPTALEQEAVTAPDLSSPEVGGGGGGGRLYNPYAEINQHLDSSTLQGLYRLPSAPEYLFTEEAEVHRRSWSENLTYYTGLGWLTGAIGGAAVGTWEGLRPGSSAALNVMPAATAAGGSAGAASATAAGTGAAAGAGMRDTLKLRVNRVLNAAGHRGRAAGNALGALGLYYSSFESLCGHYRGTDDWLNSVAAGLAAGAAYKAAAGPRTAAVAAAMGGLAAGSMLLARQLSTSFR